MTLPHIAASLMAADLTRLGDEVKAMDESGIDAFHLDIMDGHFVPNMTFSPATVKALRPLTDKFFDVHLMVERPQDWIDIFIDAGANAISFHFETVSDIDGLIAHIKRQGAQVGIAFNIGSDLTLDPRQLALIDRLLIMTIKPGFAGQEFIDMTEKIQKAAALKKTYPQLEIVVDGGINPITARQAVAAGATTLVSTSYLFKQSNYAAAIASLKAGSA